MFIVPVRGSCPTGPPRSTEAPRSALATLRVHRKSRCRASPFCSSRAGRRGRVRPAGGKRRAPPRSFPRGRKDTAEAAYDLPDSPHACARDHRAGNVGSREHAFFLEQLLDGNEPFLVITRLEVALGRHAL